MVKLRRQGNGSYAITIAKTYVDYFDWSSGEELILKPDNGRLVVEALPKKEGEKNAD